MKKHALTKIIPAAIAGILFLSSCGPGSGGSVEEPAQEGPRPIQIAEQTPAPASETGAEGAAEETRTADVAEETPPAESIVAVDAPSSNSGFLPLSTLPRDAAGSVTVLAYGAEDRLYEDVGNPGFSAEFTLHNYGDLLPLYASAVEFNKLYPYIKINVLVVTFDHDGDQDNGVSLHQCIENVKNDLGVMPDMWAVHDLKTEILTGNISDLSKYKNEASFLIFNETLMDMMDYHGFIGGIPTWYNPWGLLVNHTLAEQNNIDVPGPNWTMDQYINYVSQADMENFYGDIDMEVFLIGLGAKSVAWEATNGSGCVDFNTDEVKRLIDLLARGSRYAVYPQWAAGNISDNEMGKYWWWSTRFFYDNVLLANIWDNWMLGFLASTDPDQPYRMKPGVRWDMYPLPSSNEMPATVATVFDPMVIRNYANEPDADLKLDCAYAFAVFHNGSNEAFEGRYSITATVMNDYGDWVERKQVSDSFPLVKSPYFEYQMEFWYESPEHEALKDKSAFPGFHKCVEIYLNGEFWAMDGRTFPDKYVLDGEIRDVFEEWNGMKDAEYAGVPITDPSWANNVKSRLAEWTEKTNDRLEMARQSIKDALVRYYGYSF